MEYLLGIPSKINGDYLILETIDGMGRRIWTFPLDEYSPEQKYKIFIHNSTKIENNNLVKRIYGFLREEDCILFSLLLEIKGIGPKTSLEIVSNTSRRVVKCIKEENLMGLMSLPGVYKHAKEIMDFFRKPKNREFIEGFDIGEGDSFRTMKIMEMLEIAEEMGIDLVKTKNILENMEDIEDVDPGILIGKILEKIDDGD